MIESKLGFNKLEGKKENELVFDDSSIAKFAYNGALHYAMGVIKNEKYKEAIAIGIAGDNEKNARLKVAYVFGASSLAIKELEIKNFNFLENEESFQSFYEAATLTDEDKHKILVRGQVRLELHAKKLNKLMHSHNITAPQRVLYVAGMLLAMQNTKERKGLEIEDLKGYPKDSDDSDSKIILRRIKDFLKTRVKNPKDERKLSLMLESFKEISKDSDRDEIQKENRKEVSKLLKSPSSITKQIFAYLYTHIYSDIDGLKGHLDIMGQMYSEFLKYALGDGKELGIVLTPPYVTKMMSEILRINQDSKVMDLATGSAGFLISAMELMIDDAQKSLGKDTTKAKDKIITIKKEQLLGVELNAEMFVLATTNMILRGDGSSKIEKANTFDTPKELYSLLNPPFTFEENGMPFIRFGLDNMKEGGFGAIIIQDSAGSGKAVKSNKEILSRHTLRASIKMPMDLFQPMAGVQTSIYIFEANLPHDFNQVVKFIDFRNDGYKRTKRKLEDKDNASLRYQDLIEIYKNGLKARVKAKWNLEEVYIESYINKSGADWNFDQHKVIDTKPTLKDFKKCVSEYLAWEVSNVLKAQDSKKGGMEGNALSPRLAELEKTFKQNGGEWREFRIIDLFNYERGTRLVKGHRVTGDIPLITAGEFNQGVKEFICNVEQKIFSNAITIDMFCNSFVHIKPFCCDDNILVLTAKQQMNQYHLRFISTVIQKDKPKYGYGKQYRISSLEHHNILLPVYADSSSLRGNEATKAIHNIKSCRDISPVSQAQYDKEDTTPTSCHTEALAEVSKNTESNLCHFASTFCHSERSEESTIKPHTESNKSNSHIDKEGKTYTIAFDL